ncbi:MAG: hypothetical protein IPG91_15565 [Ideonella sp.]|nr:hypothetical protein [Ideonella sp.]
MGDTPRLFLVRVWQQQGCFRASLRGVDEEEPQLFDEPAQLGEYLRCAASAAPADPAPATASGQLGGEPS